RASSREIRRREASHHSAGAKSERGSTSRSEGVPPLAGSGLCQALGVGRRDTPGSRSERTVKAVRYSQLGGPEQVVTISDFGGAKEHGVTFSSGPDAGRAVHAIAEVGELVESGRFSLPVARTFPLAEIAQAHRVSEDGHVRGKLVLVVG